MFTTKNSKRKEIVMTADVRIKRKTEVDLVMTLSVVNKTGRDGNMTDFCENPKDVNDRFW